MDDLGGNRAVQSTMGENPAREVASTNEIDACMQQGHAAALASSESELEVEETDALLGGGRRRSRRGQDETSSWCRCWRTPGCHRVWRVVTPSVLKTVAMVVMFLVFVALFTRFPEADEGAFMYAVSSDSPLRFPVSPTAAVEATMWVQRASVAQPFLEGQSVELRLVSGSLCPANATAISDSCGMTLRLAADRRESRTETFKLDKQAAASAVLVSCNSSVPVAVMVKLLELSDVASASVVIAAVVLVCVYALIILEVVHRTLAAMLGAFAALAVLSNIHERPSFAEVMTWIDWDTCGLLFGMMVMVGIFSTTGFFEYCAVRMYKMARGNLWRLVTLLCLFTATLSAFLDNVTTILLIVPVTMQLCHVLDVDPVLPVVALVFFSNIGGTATAIGDPPNILLVSDQRLQLHSGGSISFGVMTLHMFPAALLAGLACFLLVRFYFHARVDRTPNQARAHELAIWKRTASRIVGTSPEDRQVKSELERHIATLQKQLDEEASQPTVLKEVDVSELERKYVIRDWPLFVNSSLILGTVVVLFFLHSFVEIHLNLAWIACVGAMLHMLVAGFKDVELVLEHVEWSTLMFFAALFVMMEALDRLGLIQYVGLQVASWIATVPEGGSGRLAAAVTVIVWVSGVGSAFIDNIPFTTAMIPVVVQLSSAPLSLPLGPLVWALALGACLGGNGTLVGASANVVAAGLLETAGHALSFNYFLSRGAPVAFLSLVVANVYLLVFHVAIPWY